MSNISSYTGKFRAHKNGLQDSSSAKVIKRTRESFVCAPCRKSKLRCDRGHPCSSCLRSNGGSLCIYQTHVASSNGANLTVEDRLSHLEQLVKKIIGTQGSTEPSNNGPSITINAAQVDLPPRQVENRHHTADEKNQEPTYVGSTHWSTVLDDIHELKAALVGSNGTLMEDKDSPLHVNLGAEVIFGSPNNYSLEKIISHSLPSKIEVDRLLSKYLQGGTFIVPFIHSLHFQKQYREFWNDPTAVNPLWLSMLFSICFLASRIRMAVDISHWSIDTSSPCARFHQAAGQSLVVGGYNRPQQYVPEALTMYAHCKNLRTLDPSREAGQILSIAVRMAHEMGYHRDPDSIGSFSAFDGEMRRRFWAVLKQMDLMKSFQLGLPSSIYLENCDTKPPRNLQDVDFDETTKVLPPPRPLNEGTQLLWFIVKDEQMVGFSKVCRDALSFKDRSEVEKLELDREIRNMHATIPDVLRVRPLSESIADSPFVTVTRLFVEFVYLKSLCVLHRRYMSQGDIYSAKTCIEAGKQLVGHFVEVYKEFSPGGLLQSERWMLTNYTLNDLFMGIMVLCLAAHIYAHGGSDAWWMAVDAGPVDEITALLQQSHAICVECSEVSIDARRVARAVSLVLSSPRSSTLSPSLTSNSNTVFQNMEYSLQNVALNPLPISAPNNIVPEFDESFEFLDPFSFIGNAFDNIDWTMFNT